MKPRFADTSYWVALLVQEDESHEAAVQLAKTSQQPIVTTEYVLLETANYLSSPANRPLFARLIEKLRGNPKAVIVPATSELTWRAIDLFVARRDKTWSLTDCISFTVMQDHKMTEALTADHHFEQAGFVALLRSAT